MSKQALTVHLDASLVERVQRYSRENGKALSETVSELIEQLPMNGSPERREIAPVLNGSTPGGEGAWEAELSPAVRALLGAGAGPADEEDYRAHLMEKYGR